jgi:hypothetical protein
MGDPNAHDIIRLKAAQLATELSNAIYQNAIYQSTSGGIFRSRRHAKSD